MLLGLGRSGVGRHKFGIVIGQAMVAHGSLCPSGTIQLVVDTCIETPMGRWKTSVSGDSDNIVCG